jgi:hypothetical protein
MSQKRSARFVHVKELIAGGLVLASRALLFCYSRIVAANLHRATMKKGNPEARRYKGTRGGRV